VKAKDIKPGDTVEGWTVTDVIFHVQGQPSRYGLGLILDPPVDVHVLLTLERTLYLEGHDVNGEEIWWAAEPPDGEAAKTQTCRTWYLADEEVEP
jgi:hypothetical protein